MHSYTGTSETLNRGWLIDSRIFDATLPLVPWNSNFELLASDRVYLLGVV